MALIHPRHLVESKLSVRDVALMARDAVEIRLKQIRGFVLINDASAPEAVYQESARVLK